MRPCCARRWVLRTERTVPRASPYRLRNPIREVSHAAQDVLGRAAEPGRARRRCRRLRLAHERWPEDGAAVEGKKASLSGILRRTQGQVTEHQHSTEG